MWCGVWVQIGEGSYGSVYRAVDVRDGGLVAIKVLPFDGRDNSRASLKLRKEIHILQQCQSPYIVGYRGAYQKVLTHTLAQHHVAPQLLSTTASAHCDADHALALPSVCAPLPLRGVQGSSVWIAMGYAGGGSLSDMMHACGHTFSERQIAAIMSMALQGLAALHRVGIIHRDIKGGNILADSEGVCKLADFGISATINHSLGKQRTVIGTPSHAQHAHTTHSAGTPHTQTAAQLHTSTFNSTALHLSHG